MSLKAKEYFDDPSTYSKVFSNFYNVFLLILGNTPYEKIVETE